jgi:hypothetical protein
MSKYNSNHLFDIISDPLFKEITSPKFFNKDRSEQQNIYNKIEGFRKYNIPFEKVFELSKDFFYASEKFISSLLEKYISSILNLQETNGSWQFADPDYLNALRPDLSSSIYDISKHSINKKIATPWVNSLVIILLKKWRDYFFTNPNLNKKPYQKSDIDIFNEKISKCEKWLRSNVLKDQEHDFRGWTFLPSATKRVCTYETSIVLISLNYHNGFGFENKLTKPRFVGEQYLFSLLSNQIRNLDGSWKIEPGRETDSGSTSYALLSLLKYCELCSKTDHDELHKAIINGINWLIYHQREDGGWGKKEKEQSDMSYVEKTSVALMALSKFRTLFSNDYSDNIDNGIQFLKNTLNTLEFFPEKYAWYDDYSDNPTPNIKFSSLAISAMLRCGIPSYDAGLKKWLMGIIRFYEEIPNKDIISWEDKIYYCCMLADYFRVLE